jgi:hypothetical protein
MFNPNEIVIEAFVERLQVNYRHNFGALEPSIPNVLAWTARLALENIANADTLYHNVDHTILVAMAGQEILRGKHLREGGVTPRDWLHYVMALLFHDIGFVRGVCRDDTEGEYATGVAGRRVSLPPQTTDAALMPYHVDRAKLFVRERFGEALLVDLDVEQIASLIEATRFPIKGGPDPTEPAEYEGLTRAADFIGQLGDPDYLRKIPALYHELQDSGLLHVAGYSSPEHMRSSYARFYWNSIRPHIGEALSYLQLTLEGRRWIAGLHQHVFDVEHGQ